MLVHPVLLSCSQTRVRKMMGNRLGSTWAWFSNKNRALWSNSDNSWPYTNPFVLCLLLCLFFKVFFHKFGWVSNQLGSSTRQRKMKFKSKRLLGLGCKLSYCWATSFLSFLLYRGNESFASLPLVVGLILLCRFLHPLPHPLLPLLLLLFQISCLVLNFS